MTETKKKFRLSDVWKFLKNSLVAILRGELLLRLNVNKYFPQIAYTFLLFALSILFSIMVDGTLGKVEQNKQTLQEPAQGECRWQDQRDQSSAQRTQRRRKSPP